MYSRRVTYGLSENAKQFILKYILEKRAKEKMDAIKRGDKCLPY